MSFKILSDFDGVWTNPGHEAESVRALMTREIARLTGASPSQVVSDFHAFHAVARAKPSCFGWAPPRFTQGRVTAFVDEDPFCAGNAIASVMGAIARGLLEHPDGELVTRAKDYGHAVLSKGFDQGFASTSDFADFAFLAATAAYREEVAHALVDRAHGIAMAILEDDMELVVVSNSSTDKLKAWFEAVEIPCFGHDEARPAGRAARLCGSAGKFILGATHAHMAIADRHVYIDRPQYRAVIEAENPDLVIGDVFSLDLALPASMRAARESCAPGTLVLRRHDYSHAWCAEERAEGHIDHVIDDLDDLVPIAVRARAAH